MASASIPAQTFEKIQELVRVGNRGVRKAQEENRRLGIPNVYSINGILYYELPNGELSRNDPTYGKSSTVGRHKLMRDLMGKHRIRSVSDFAEQIVAEALNGMREQNGVNKGFDLRAPGLGRVEVKFRQLPQNGRLEERVSLNGTKVDGFDYLAVVIFAPDFRVKGAVLVPYLEAWKFISASPYNRISYSQACSCNGAINITHEVDAAAQR